ncbi:MAG: NAD-dependent epimerase/dehydratase family protein [Lautropia sp.]|nr:NAD-dependent epimerase/dehydratase family protein [Lautropia sp.]
MKDCNGNSSSVDSPDAPVVITGAAGFIGQHLVRQLLQAGAHVRAITRQPAQFLLPTRSGPPPAAAEQRRLDILPHPGNGTAAAWLPLLADARAIIHCAGIAHLPLGADRARQRQLRRVNVEEPRRIAQAAAQAQVKQLIFLSSIKAAGEWSRPGHPLRENDPPRPEDCYGWAKRAAERHLQRQQRQADNPLSITILRLPLVYGPGVKANFAALQKLAASGLPLPLGSIDNQRSFLAIDNLCSAIQTILARPEQASGLFHLSDGPALSTPELIRALASAAGKPARLLRCPPALLGSLARLVGQAGAWQRLSGSLAVDNQLFCRQFDWRPALDCSEALARLHSQDRMSPRRGTP